MTKAILLDIEGTTTPIDFVHKTLFPYASERIDSYVRDNFDSLHAEVFALRKEHAGDVGYPYDFDETSFRSIADYLRYLIEADRKSTPLKTIQGKIWQQGYESGDLRSEVFDDVPPAFERWRKEGRTIAIYSSGSVLAQKLLFKYTEYGNLTVFISHYFDTNIGGKREAQSYRTTANSLNLPSASIMFVSDVPAELTAADDAGLSTVLSVRPGNEPVENIENWRIVTSFEAL